MRLGLLQRQGLQAFRSLSIGRALLQVRLCVERHELQVHVSEASEAPMEGVNCKTVGKTQTQ